MLVYPLSKNINLMFKKLSVFEKKERLKKKNRSQKHRPTSLLPPLSKSIEKSVDCQIYYLKANDLFCIFCLTGILKEFLPA